MKLDYNIYEEIGSDWGIGLSAQTFNEDTKELKAGDELVLHFNSPGGSVTEGIAMANRISALGKSGVKTTAIVEGICASIATVMMCACETVKMNRSAFCMIHNCWAVVQGDADELRKQADVMEKMNDAIMSFYRSKFDLTDDELRSYMDAETWFSGMEAADFKFKCEVIEDETDMKLAAKFDLTRFHKLPEVLNMTKKEEQANEQKDEAVENKAEETKEEETVVEEPEKTEEPDTEEPEKTEEPDEVKELKARIAELEAENEELKKKCAELNASQSEATITKEEADKRVSGMQAKMQSQVNALTSEITNFKNQLQAKDEELKSAKAEITSLNDSLTKSTEELSAMASALEEKTHALEKLNQGVNAQAEELPTMKDGLAKCATPAEKVAFLKSGHYVR